MTAIGAADVDALAGALREAVPDDGIRPSLVALQVVAVQQALARTNWSAIAAGRSADDVHPTAVADVDAAFALLTGGATGY